MNQLTRGLWLYALGALGAGCSGEIDGAANQLGPAPPQLSARASCASIADWESCVSNDCLWGGPDQCDGRSAPVGAVTHLSQGGCFAATRCAEDSQCGSAARCVFLAYAPCYFTPDGDGPQCTASGGQFCTYLEACVAVSP